MKGSGGKREARSGWTFFRRGGAQVSLVGEGTSLVGEVRFAEETMRLDGRLEGKVAGSGTLIIGPQGLLQGEMEVGRLLVCGRVEGKVSALDGVHIASSGRLLGRIQTSCLTIEEGGIFHGVSAPPGPRPAGAGQAEGGEKAPGPASKIDSLPLAESRH